MLTGVVEGLENVSHFGNQDGAVLRHTDKDFNSFQQVLLSLDVVTAKADRKNMDVLVVELRSLPT